MSDEQLREKLAALAHEQWSGWMQYMFDKCEVGTFNVPPLYGKVPDGTLVIPRWAVERWFRQMNTPYEELPEEEKESDRKEADRVLALLGE